MSRILKLHITITGNKITSGIELQRDGTRCLSQMWIDADGATHLTQTWERDPTFLERIGRKVSGLVAKVRAV